jgi:hypothetical protein
MSKHSLTSSALNFSIARDLVRAREVQSRKAELLMVVTFSMVIETMRGLAALLAAAGDAGRQTVRLYLDSPK